MSLREGVRALILDEDDAVLLVRFDWDGLDVPGGFWANPGGGVEPGESRFDALARELAEEVGLVLRDAADLGPEVWTKTAVFPMPPWDGQVDHIHLLRVPRFIPRPAMSAAQLQAENVQEIRWWSRHEMRTTDATFAPRALPALLDALLAGELPEEPHALTGF
ncbi:MAG: NUDIX domain-containing protein [Motilibacteraceae bacterium]